MWNKSPSYQSRASRNARQCQSVFRFAPHRLPQTRIAESLRCTPLPVYVGPRRSGQSLPPVPSPQFSAESAEPFGLVILAGSNLLRLHFQQRLPSAGPTLPCEGQSNCALFPGQCQSRKDRHPSHQRPASPPHHGISRRPVIVPTDHPIQLPTDCPIQFITDCPIQFITDCPIQFTTESPIQLPTGCCLQSCAILRHLP